MVDTCVVDVDVVAGICVAATAGSGSGSVFDVVTDRLDGSVWVSMSSSRRAGEARRALHAHGLDVRDAAPCRLHVLGWERRLLRHRLGVLLSGVDDLSTEWDATAELVCYHHDRRLDATDEPEPSDVVADVETALRGCVPIPHRVPPVDDIDRLLDLIAAAEDAYQRLLAEHLDYAERVLDSYVGNRGCDGVA
jgi:hypothetical protein